MNGVGGNSDKSRKQPYFTKLEYKSSQHDVRPYSIMIENIAPNDSNLLNSI